MNERTRRAVAYIAGCVSSGRSSSAIYDCSCSRVFGFSGKVTESKVAAYDYSEQCHIGGSGRDGTFSLFHYGDQSQISLRVEGRKFRGFDYGSGGQFSGTVSGRTVSVFDSLNGSLFTYNV